MNPHTQEMIHRTNALCTTDPRPKALRLLLLKIERLDHARGWNHPDNLARLFQVDASLDTPDVNYTWCADYTTLIRLTAHHNGGNIGAAVKRLGRIAQDAAAAVHDGIPPASWFDADSHDQEGVTALLQSDTMSQLRERSQRGADLAVAATGQPGLHLYGYGFIGEAWGIERASIEEEAMIRQHRLDELDRRREERQVMIATRDGLVWTATRPRDEHPYVIAHMPEGDMTHVGDIVHGLTCMIDGAVNNPVRHWAADNPGSRERRKPNPLFK